MGRTIIGVNDPRAIKYYSAALAEDTPTKSYWDRFASNKPGASSPVTILDDLEEDAGDYVSFDLNMQLKMKPVEGDDVLEGKEENLVFYTDGLYIDQIRGGVNTGGRMTKKRTLHNLRQIAKARQSDWWGRIFDELHFMYASGARGVNNDYVFDTTYSGFAGNPITAPDSSHMVFANSKTKSTITTDDKMSLGAIDRLVSIADMMGGGTQGTPQIQPIKIDGEDHYVLVMNPWQEFDMRTNITTGQWMDIQKAMAPAEGKASKLCQGGLGMYNNVIMHKHKNAIQFNDYGSGGNISAVRSLFLGEQAMAFAWGKTGTEKMRFQWHEETRDNGNVVVITAHSIFGLKKVVYNGLDYGIMAYDTAAKAA